MKLQPKTSYKQTYLKVAASSFVLLLIGFFSLVYVMDWDLGISQPPQGGQSNQLSSLQSGTWGNGNTWNMGQSQTTASANFQGRRQELDFNLDTVNFTGGLIKGNKNNFKSLKKCKGNSKPTAICRALGNGSGKEVGEDVIKTQDGNYVAIGRTTSFNNNGQLYVVKFKIGNNSKFQKLWDVQVGNKNQSDHGYSIVQNSNGDFIAVGATKVNNFGKQGYIIKLNSSGKLQWQRAVGPQSKDIAKDIILTAKGNYLLTGTSKKWGHNSKGIYVLNFKLRSSGKGIVKQWDRIIGAPSKTDKGVASGQLSNGDFVVTGYTGYDKNGNQSNGEIYVARLTSNGNVEWGKTIGSPRTDYPRDLVVDNNDNIVIAGNGKFSVNGSGKMSAIVLKLDKSGNLLWNTGFRKQNLKGHARSVAVLNNNQYLIGGYSSTPNSNKDAYVAKLNTTGKVQWDKVGGASSNEKVYGILPKNNGNFWAVGRTNSSRSGNGDMLISNVTSNGKICANCSQNSVNSYSKQGLKHFKAFNNGDFLHDVKTVTTSNTAISSTTKSGSSCAPFCSGFDGGGNDWFNDVIETSNGYIYVGRSSSFGNGSKNIFAVKVNDNFKVQWEHIIGSGNGYEEAQAIVSTGNTDEYLIAGKSKVQSFGNHDIYLVKIKDKGSKVKVKKEWLVGGPSNDLANDLVKLNNGDFILTGKTKSYVNNSDGILLRFSLSPFNLKWKTLFGDPNTGEGANAITSAASNTVTTVSYTHSQNNTGIYVTQFDTDGNFRWGNVLGGPNTDKPFGIASTNQKDVVIAGQSKVNGVTGTQDVYVAKLSGSGKKNWGKAMGESNGTDRGRAIIVNNLGNIVVTGEFKDQNTKEVYFATLTSSGTSLYTNDFGGASLDYGQTLIQNSNNDYIIGGRSQSSTYSNNNNAALAYRVKANGVVSSNNGGSGGSGGSGGGSGGSGSGQNKPIPKSKDRAVVTKQTITVKNSNHSVGVLQLQKKGKVVVDSGRKLTVEDKLNLGSGDLQVEEGGELVVPDTASINGINGDNLKGEISFKNSNGFVDSTVFREDKNQKIRKVAVHDFGKGNDFKTTYYKKNSNNVGSTLEQGLYSVSHSEYFDISRQKGQGSVKVTLFWSKSSPTPLNNLSNKKDLVVAHYNGNKWESIGQSNFNGKLKSSGYITSTNFSSFSEFSFGSTDQGGPLPVELRGFDAEKEDDQVNLEWSTASETNNNYFKVQRRGSNGTFQTIGKVDGAGTTLEPQDYDFMDPNPVSGTNYYRLKQVDHDGSYEYSKIEAVEFQESDRQKSLTLEKAYPNPFQRQIQIVFTLPTSQAVQLRLRSTTGRILVNRSIVGKEGKNQHSIQVNQNLQRGAYILTIQSSQNQVTKKLIHR